MKILFLNPAGLIGGAERVLLDVIASLRAARPDWPLALIAAADGDLFGSSAADEEPSDTGAPQPAGAGA